MVREGSRACPLAREHLSGMLGAAAGRGDQHADRLESGRRVRNWRQHALWMPAASGRQDEHRKENKPSTPTGAAKMEDDRSWFRCSLCFLFQ